MSQFSKDQLVWAKIKGYPWWPAVVGKSFGGKEARDNREFLVNFIGDYTHATLPESKLVEFKDGLGKFSNVKTKRLVESISMARNIFDGASTFEEENAKIMKKSKPAEKTASSTTNTSRASQKTANKSESTSRGRSNSVKSPIQKGSNAGRGNKGTPLQIQAGKTSSRTGPSHKMTKRASAKLAESTKPSQKRSTTRGESNSLAKNEQTNNDSISAKVHRSLGTAASNEKNSNKQKAAAKAPQNKRKTAQPKRKIAQKNNASTSEEDDDKSTSSDEEEIKHVFQKKQKRENATAVITSRTVSKNGDAVKVAGSTSQSHKKTQISQFEQNLKEVLATISDLCKNEKVINGNNKEYLDLVNTLTIFNNYDFPGNQLVSSNIGKLFKSIHYLLTEHKAKLDEKGLELLIKIGRIIHNIKQRIMQHCLDTTDLLSALDIPKREARKKSEQFIDIDNMKMKVEEFDGSSSSATARVEPVKPKLKEVPTKSSSNQNKRILNETIEPPKIEEENLNDNNLQKSQTGTRSNTTLGSPNEAPYGMSKLAAQSQPSTKTSSSIIEESKQAKIEGDCSLKASPPTLGKHHSSNSQREVEMSMRKKIGLKLAKFLSATFEIQKAETQAMASKVEKKILSFFNDSPNHYKTAFHSLYRLIKDKKIGLDTLSKFDKLNHEEFEALVQAKLKGNNNRDVRGEVLTEEEPKLLIHQNTGETVKSSPKYSPERIKEEIMVEEQLVAE